MAFQFNSDRLKKRIQEALGKIYTEADPTLLNKYRKVMKKEVSFFSRSNLTAWLLMEQDQRGGYSGRWSQDQRSADRRPADQRSVGDSGRNERENRGDKGNRSRRAGNNAAEDRPRNTDPNGYPLADEDSVRLFFSAGRSRRVFPREILGLIISKTSISRDDVGAIHILDNYSFVQVRNTLADTIIEALNGKPFRGRPLSVNYARARKDAQTDEDSLDQRSIDQRSIDQRSIDQRSIDQRSVDQEFVDQNESRSSVPYSRSIPSSGDPDFAADESEDSIDLDNSEQDTFLSADNSIDDSEAYSTDTGDEPSYSDSENDDDRPDEESV
ncbi:hypothetical protein AGMMS49991_09790 [Spirochaetia bacterium]|nr:hypothetical protein AGMMS49991_09790 [Spirochaetia bacterium]